MKRLILSTAVSLVVVGTLNASEVLNIHPGWQLLGSSNTIEDVASTFGSSNIKTVWVFDDMTNSWKAYSPDSNIMQLINDNEFVGVLNSIGPNRGFWVNAIGYETVTLGSNDENLPPVNGDRSFHFADNLVGVQLSTLAGKTFKIVDLGGGEEEEDVSLIPVTFDDNGTTQLVDEHRYCYGEEQNTTSITVTFELVEDALRVYDGRDFREYKILAQDEIGIVFGALDVGLNDYIEWKGEYLPPVLVFLNENTVETPVDMSSVLPYKAYHSWSKNNYISYEQNGSVIDSYDGYVDERGTFEIVDSKISAMQADEWEGGGYEDHYTLQTIYTIDHYDINRVDFSGYHYDTIVHYEDENGSWSDFNLTANPDVDTWQELFAQTNWTLGDTKYYENNGTIEYDETFTISDDGKVLSIVTKCGDVYNQTIESGKIYENWSGIWVGVTSSTPIYEMETTTTSSELLSAKVNNKKREPLNFLPPYVRKAILKK